MIKKNKEEENNNEAPKKIKLKYQAPTGMHDIFGDDQFYFRKVYDAVENIGSFYGFQKIDTPILEDSQVFEKSIGAGSDIVDKEMYSFKTKGGDSLCLRPEFTAGVSRAYLQNAMYMLPKPIKLMSYGPLFRYEKPQAGRYRQFHQFNFEVFGSKDPIVDAQLIQMLWALMDNLKFKDLIVEINSIGCKECRGAYRKSLIRFLKNKESMLSADSKKRLKKNPLRILDSKDEKDREVIAKAPQILDFLCDDCKAHFKSVLEYLDGIGLPYKLNPYLVRGLDYYTKTVFEIVEDNQEGLTDTLVGGGRYDSLVQNLGGQDCPAVGAAGGIERIVLKLKEKKLSVPKNKTRVFLAPLGESAKRQALGLFEEFRKDNIKVSESFSKDALKAQLGLADKYGVDYTIIIGQREVLDGTAIIRDMKTAKQITIKADKIVKELKKKLKKK